MIKLYVNGSLVDLTGSESIAIDYSIAKIADISKRSGTRSAQFKLPNTANNRRIYESIDALTSNSLIPYKTCDALLYVDGIDQQIRFATISSFKNGYNINLYGTQTDLYGYLKSQKCEDLDLRKYDHFWTLNNCVSFRNRSDGFIYPITDNYTDSPNADMDNANRRINVISQRAAPRYEDMVKEIIEQAGYQFENKLLEYSEYPNDGICIPFNNGEVIRNKRMSRYEATWNIDSQTISSLLTFPYIVLNPASNGENYLSEDNLISNVQKFADSFFADIHIELTITNPNNFWVNVAIQLPFNISYHDLNPLETRTIVLDFTQEGIGYDGVPVGDMSIRMDATMDVQVQGFFTFSNCTWLNNGPTVYDTLIPSGAQSLNYITLSTMLPNWTQAELISNYLKLTGSLLNVDEFNRKVTIVPFKKIVENIRIANDWSDKLDISEDFELTYKLDSYGQTNYLRYKEDETVVKPDGTDYQFTINDTTLPIENELFELGFAATETNTRLIGMPLPRIKIIEQATGDFSKVVERILAIKFIDASSLPSPATPLTYTDGTNTATVTTDIPVPYFISENELNNLGLDNSLKIWYKAWIDVLDKAKIITCLFKLNASDIYSLDLTIPVYVKYFGAWFYISEVKEYTPNKNQSTQVELVKIF